jgi:hypothetical protein
VFSNTNIATQAQNVTAAQAAQQAASNSTSAAASGSNQAQQIASVTNSQSATQQSQSSAQVFNNLQTLNSHHMVLNVTMTATQANSVIQLFQGANGVVQQFQNFNVNTPLCTGGVVTPVVATPL